MLDLDTSGQPRKALMSARVSIRNTSLKIPIRVYLVTEGRLLKEFAPSTRTVPTIATMKLFVAKSELADGLDVIIQWEAASETTHPRSKPWTRTF